MPEDPSQPKPATKQNEEQDRQEQELANVEAQDSPQTSPDTSVSSSGASTPSFGQYVSSQSSSKKSKKGLIIGAIIAGVFAIFGGGSALAYTWYQNPDKVVADGLMSAIHARTATMNGTVLYTSKDTDVSIALDSRGGLEDGGMMSAKLSFTSNERKITIDLEGEAVYAQNGDVYFKVSKVKQAFDKFLNVMVDQMAAEAQKEGQKISKAEIDQGKAMYRQLFEPVVLKVDNQWIKVSVADLEKTNKESSEEYKCVQTQLKKLYNDKKTKDDMMGIYQRNKFLVVKEQLGVRDGNLGYVIDIDEAKSKKFGEEFEQSQLSKDIKACSKSEDDKSEKDDSASGESNSSMKGRVEVWIGQWNHVLAKVKGETTSKVGDQEQKVTFDFSTKFNEPTRVTLPQNAMTIDQFNKEIESVTGSMLGGMNEEEAVPATRA